MEVRSLQLTQAQPGYNWKLDDPGGLYLAGTGHLENPPLAVEAKRLGQAGMVEPTSLEIALHDLEFLAVGLFGAARPSRACRNVTWTGDAYKYALYHYAYGVSRHPAIVVLRTDGSGTYAYVDDTVAALETWTTISEQPPEMIWNICHLIVQTYERAFCAGRAHLEQLFLEGRLKKRRRQGRVSVQVAARKEA
jgi:hypothetical protein